MKIITDPNLTASKKDEPVPYFWWKRIFDLTLSGLLLILLAPVFLLIFLAAKLEGLIYPESRGPLIYSETRISHGRPFRLLKIRIVKMSAINDTLKKFGFIHTKPLERVPANLTGIGKILKKIYLDELPQLINIFMGEMSFVGPRPWNTVLYNKEIGKKIYRKKVVKAGLTGLVQINKCNQFFPVADLMLDDYYINYCRQKSEIKIFFLDLKIIGLSIIKILKGQGL